jgi:hypothetical protein
MTATERSRQHRQRRWLVRRAVALSTDTIFLDVLSTGTGVMSNASTGDFAHDLMTAAKAINLGASSRPYLILPPDSAKPIALEHGPSGLLFPQMGVTGGTIQGIRVLVSDAATTDAYLIDASQIAAQSDLIVLQPGDHAAIQMDDNPTAGAKSLVSLWQNDLTGLRAERTFGVEVLRSTAVALITGMNVTV